MPKMEDYRQAQIMTSTPMELIIILYDECVKSLTSAEEAFSLTGNEKYQEINNQLLHAQDIITELSVSLDMEKGGEIAFNLQRLYDFMSRHLSYANIHKSVKHVSDVKAMAMELRDAWRQVAEKEPSKVDADTGEEDKLCGAA